MFIITQRCTHTPWNSHPSSSWTLPSFSSCLLSYLTLNSGYLPYRLGIPREYKLFCPPLRSPQGPAQCTGLLQSSAALSWVELKTGHPWEQLRTMLRSTQAPCSAKAGKPGSSLACLPSKLLLSLQSLAQMSVPSEDSSLHPDKTIPWCVLADHCVNISTFAWLHLSASISSAWPGPTKGLGSPFWKASVSIKFFSVASTWKMLNKCKLPNEMSAGIDSLGIEQSYSWRSPRTGNQLWLLGGSFLPSYNLLDPNSIYGP